MRAQEITVAVVLTVFWVLAVLFELRLEIKQAPFSLGLFTQSVASSHIKLESRPCAIRRSYIGTDALCLRSYRRHGSVLSAVSLRGDRANRHRACRDNRRAAGELRERELMLWWRALCSLIEPTPNEKARNGQDVTGQSDNWGFDCLYTKKGWMAFLGP